MLKLMMARRCDEYKYDASYKIAPPQVDHVLVTKGSKTVRLASVRNKYRKGLTSASMNRNDTRGDYSYITIATSTTTKKGQTYTEDEIYAAFDILRDALVNIQL